MRTKAKDGGCTTSIWTDVETPRFDVRPAHETDVCVIGAGIAGLTTAYQLVRQGMRVIVLDDGPIGGGETGRTSAHLASAVDDRYYVLENKFGEDGARIVHESHAAAIDFIETTVRELSINCDFRRVDGYLFAPPGESDDRTLDKELAAARRAGLVVDKVSQAPLPFDAGPALRFARQAEFHPLAYLRGLAEAIVDNGGVIHTRAHVDAIEPGSPLTVKLSTGRTLLCRIAVDATNGAITSPIHLPLRQAAYRTYVVTFEIPMGAIPHALYWDTADPYHYIRVAKGAGDRELLIVGGNDHRVGQGDPQAAWVGLEAWTRRWIPIVGEVVARWSGQIIEPSDGPAHIGKSPELDHVFVASGDSGNGLTHGTIAGLMLPDLMRGTPHRWQQVYDPSRSHLHAFGALASEAVRSSMPYADWVRGGDVASVDQIKQGEGAVVRRGLHLVAVYRDEAGVCHERSATCPHLRGVVHWNAGEKTWDCPCHGSRFDPYGRVVNGPAATDLASIEEPRAGETIPIPVERKRGPAVDLREPDLVPDPVLRPSKA